MPGARMHQDAGQNKARPLEGDFGRACASGEETGRGREPRLGKGGIKIQRFNDENGVIA